MVTALNVISCWLISSPDMGISLGWLQRQNADEWQESECWVSDGEQQAFTTSPIASAVTNRKEAHFGRTPAVAGSPCVWKAVIQKVFHKRQKENCWSFPRQWLARHITHPSILYPPFYILDCRSGVRWGTKAHAPALCACSQCNISVAYKSRAACTMARAKHKNQ